jgi:NitT/TauT family transport system permease protein
MASSYLPQSIRAKVRIGWADIIIFVVIFGLFFSLKHLGHDMQAPFSPHRQMTINLSPRALPGYAARSLLRMFIAFGVSILFTFIYGYIAAHNLAARRIMIPLLDILQSVPVLGFLSVTVTGFMALFPGSLLGLECASIFAIFTGQAWNMTFSFYQSLITIPKELREAATVYQLNWWQRFVKLEVPFSMIGLVWNGMMSFGGGWFFLAASEAITVLNNNFLLPGIGSYMAVAVEKRNVNAELWAIVTMVIIVLLVDQLFWRPIVAWSQKFKFEQTDSSDEPTSVVLDIIRQSKALPWLSKRIGAPTARGLNRIFGTASKIAESGGHVTYITRRAFSIAMGLAAVVGICYWLFRGFEVVRSGVTISMLEEVFRLTCFTLLRVISMVVFATIVWTPIGVAIGFSPKLSRIAQPLVQIGASFPANLLFPLVVLAFQYFHIGLNWGSVILIALGTQWYILFNVIAGASSVPSDLREAATVFRLTRWNLWRTLILPAIFPAWVTGALTAAGGAWNASIVAEIAQTGPNSFLHAEGIGNYIAVQTTGGNWPGIITGIGMMSLFVVILNKLVWRRLYTVGETRFGLG